MLDQCVAVPTRDDGVPRGVDVGARDDPARRSRADGPVLGQRHLDRRHALFTPTLAKHRHHRPFSPVIERFDQLGDPLVDEQQSDKRPLARAPSETDWLRLSGRVLREQL